MEKSVTTDISTTNCFNSGDDQSKTDSNDMPDKKTPYVTNGFTTVKKPLRKFTFDGYFKNTKTRSHHSQHFTSGTSLASSWMWKTHKSLIYGLSTPNPKQSNKIALFDMDGTLVTNKKGRSHSDWEFFHPSVPHRLRELREQGYRIVIASNQLGISLNLVSETVMQGKIENFSREIGVEITVMLATKDDRFRKPDTGMWYFLLNTLNHAKVDLDQCVDF